MGVWVKLGRRENYTERMFYVEKSSVNKSEDKVNELSK